MHELVIDYCRQVFKGSTLGNPRSNLTKLLDAGCGTGGLTEKLESFGQVVGLDISTVALSYAMSKKITLVNASVNSLPLVSESFDLVVSTSVIYHRLVDDDMALDEFHRVLNRNGRLILILPAFSWAYSHHDDAVHTRRRYTLAEARQLVQSAGMRIVSSHYIYSFLFPLFILKRFLETVVFKTNRVSDLVMPHPIVNTLLECICRLEWKLPDWVHLPFGSSLLVIAQKGRINA